MAQAGEGIYSLTFKTRDLKKAADFLRSKQQPIETQDADSLVLSRDSTFGMTIAFTQRSIPNDAR
jgi:hypothetical protein